MLLKYKNRAAFGENLHRGFLGSFFRFFHFPITNVVDTKWQDEIRARIPCSGNASTSAEFLHLQRKYPEFTSRYGLKQWEAGF